MELKEGRFFIMKTKKLLFLSLLFCSCFLTSCSALLGYTALYDISLASVECPTNVKEQYGETKVVKFEEEGTTKYTYEDNYIETIWYVGTKQFYFTLKNKSNHAIKINWDDISYVDINGNVGRVMHSGVKYTDRNNSQPPTTIPRNAKISDILLPTDNVYYISGEYGGWKESYLISSKYQTQEDFNNKAGDIVGKTLTIMMPIMIEGIQNDYTFIFSVDNYRLMQYSF